MDEHPLNSRGQEEAGNVYRSAEYIARYLHLVGEDNLFDPDKFLHAFAEKSNDELIKIATTINLFAREVPLRTPERGRTPAYQEWRLAYLDKHRGICKMKMDHSNRVLIASYDLVPPKPDVSKSMFDDALSTLKERIRSSDPQAANVVARTLYHTVYYLQPFPDANKRTARLMYYLFSPLVIKRVETFDDDIVRILEHQDDGLEDYDLVLKRHVGEDMLKSRGLPTDYDEQLNEFSVNLVLDNVIGFDANFLGFLAVWDLLDDNMREDLKHKINDSPAFYLEQRDLPKRVRGERVRDEFAPYRLPSAGFMQPVREEFSRRVIGYGLQADPQFPKDLQLLFDRAFEPYR